MSENRNPQIIPHDETHGDYGRGDKVDVPTPRTEAIFAEISTFFDTFRKVDRMLLDHSRRLERELAAYKKAWGDQVLHVACAASGCQYARSAGTSITCSDAKEKEEGCFRAVRAERLLCEAEAKLSAQSATGAITPHPGAGRLNQAYTPVRYDGQAESAPPPYINISEAKTPYEEAIITLRSPRKADGSPGDSAFIVMTKRDLRSLFLRVARYWGWLPMTEEQWQLDYYLDNPDEAKKSRERIVQLRLQRDRAQRVVEETTATLAGIPTPP